MIPTTAKKDDTEESNTPSTANVQKPSEAVNTDIAQTTESAGDAASNEEAVDRRKILIKLKYLNDTLKEVEGSLDELLKDFKWLVSFR